MPYSHRLTLSVYKVPISGRETKFLQAMVLIYVLTQNIQAFSDIHTQSLYYQAKDTTPTGFSKKHVITYNGTQ